MTNPSVNPAAWLRPVPDEEKTIDELCREWRLVEAKMLYELACLADTIDGTDSDRLVEAANVRMYEIEAELKDREPGTLDELQGILGIALRIIREGGTGDERELTMLGAVHSGISFVRNALERRTAA